MAILQSLPWCTVQRFSSLLPLWATIAVPQICILSFLVTLLEGCIVLPGWLQRGYMLILPWRLIIEHDWFCHARGINCPYCITKMRLLEQRTQWNSKMLQLAQIMIEYQFTKTHPALFMFFTYICMDFS